MTGAAPAVPRLLFLVIAGIAVCREAAAEHYAWIRVDGTKLVTLQNANSPCHEFIPVGVSYRDDGDDEAFIRFCKDFALNTVRFRFLTNVVRNDGRIWDMDTEIDRIRAWVALARAHGLYTILDNHDFKG